MFTLIIMIIIMLIIISNNTIVDNDENSGNKNRIECLEVLSYPTGQTCTPTLSNRAPFKKDEIM